MTSPYFPIFSTFFDVKKRGRNEVGRVTLPCFGLDPPSSIEITEFLAMQGGAHRGEGRLVQTGVN